LIVSRLLSPGSKKKAFEETGRYFERFNFSPAIADVRAIRICIKTQELLSKAILKGTYKKR